MRKYIIRVAIGLGIFVVILGMSLYILSRKDMPDHITYGISFNASYAKELGLDEKRVFDAFLDDLGVRHLRLSAQWPLIEPKKDSYDFEFMDYQVTQTEKAGGDIIFGVGRRLPRWPECHIPAWAKDLSWEDQKTEILKYITTVVTRYRDQPAIKYWQVENEPYLGVFATDYCGKLDEAFLEKEIALVHSLDPVRPILVTDSGNLGTWNGAYHHGDVFGTSVYVYFWNPELGQFKTVLPPWFYRVKENVMKLLFGKKETMLIELSAEPWLLEPVTQVPIETQYTRMNINKFNEILDYAQQTGFSKQYLWGGEWWYWLRTKGYTEMWDRGKELFR